MSSHPVLLADIGGTHARFALLDGDAIRHPTVLRCADYDGPAAAALAFLDRHPDRPSRAAFAVAACVEGDELHIPNAGWRFSIAATRRTLGLERLDAINDFTAQAVAVPTLAPAHFLAIGGGSARPASPIAVLGPGTGLGVSGLVPTANGPWLALDTEGGHATMAAANDREAEILAWLRRHHGHVSAERVLSGPGLVNLYQAVTNGETRPAADIARAAMDGSCPSCAETLGLFFAMLGTVAANLALSIGARGGVVLAGGILPRMAETFATSSFRARFEDHGAYGPYLAAIPTRLMMHPHPAFIGLADWVSRDHNQNE